GPGEAEVLARLAAQIAAAAPPVRFDGHPISRCDAGHARPDGHDIADELVPGNQRVPDPPLSRPDPVVGPADAGSADTDEHLAASGGRVTHRLDLEGARSHEYGCPHDALNPRRGRDSRQWWPRRAASGGAGLAGARRLSPVQRLDDLGVLLPDVSSLDLQG